MSQSSVYAEKVMEDLDALLADLQSTTANIGYTHQQPAQSPAPVQTRDTGVSQHQQQVGGVNLRASSTSSSSPRTSGSGVGGGGVHHHHHHHQGAAAGSRASQTPPPLPPPPHDIPDTIPPPQQFGDQQQPLYEAQNVRRDTTPNTSYNSSFNNSNSYNRRSGSSDPPQSPYYTHRAEPSPGPGPVPATSQPHPGGSSMISNNLSELDQLLSDLNSAQFMAEVDKKHSTSSSQSGSTVTQSSSSQQATWNPPGKQPPPPVAPKPNRGGGGGNTSVDNLLDQLETSNSPAGPHGGYPVQTNAVNGSYATVGESHSQSYSYSDSSHSGGGGGGPGMGGPHSPAQIMSSQVVISPAPAQVISPAPQPSSAATQELDDLMQSLSGFKMKENQQQQQPQSGQIHASVPQSPQPYPPGAQVHIQPQPQPPRSPSPGSEPSYAKPHKSRNLSQSGSSSANSSMQMSGGQNVQGNNMAGGAAQGGQLESMLGDLQSDLSKQGVETKTKGLCAACNQPVVGQVITALGKIWHIEHFTCDHCHTVLGTKNFYERDGVAYCERDYHSLFAPRCAYCNGPITDKCVTALDRTWHPEHFFCAQCGRPFGEDGFHEKDGKAYCRADFFEMFAPKCGGCGRAIVDNYISALNRHWHPECFACFECHHPFAGGKFFDYEGLPYCETHYHAKRGSLCAGCQKPISGRCITAMSRKFHPEHFVCAFCLKQLNKGTFKEQNDRPYCHPCFVKLFG